MATDNDKRRKARSDYIYKRKTLAMIALSIGVSSATIGRWKAAAKKKGDDWEIARTAHIVAGQGLDAVIVTVVEEFMIMAQSLIEELKQPGQPLDTRVQQITSLADAMNKMTVSAGKLAPKISELAIADEVIQRLLAYVQEHHPNHVPVMQEVLEPFGEQLGEVFK